MHRLTMRSYPLLLPTLWFILGLVLADQMSLPPLVAFAATASALLLCALRQASARSLALLRL